MNGAELVCRTLEGLGAECVFGLPGTQNVDLFEGLRRSRLRTIVATSELAAGFMACGYARASGRVGVLVTIPGPGFTWALTALAEARHDSTPLLHLTGAPEDGRPFALQAIDQQAMASPVCKAVIRAGRVGDLAVAVVRAHALALSGEPGPVVLEIPPQLLRGDMPGDPAPIPALPSAAPPLDVEQASLLLTRVRAARRPAFLVGQGVAGSALSLRALVERLGAPVLATISGRGALPEDHPLSLGIDLGPYSIAGVNALLDRADLVMALGCKLSHNGSAGFQLRLPPERFIHVDPSAEVLGANYPAGLSLEADAASVLTALSAEDLARSEWTVEDLAAARAGDWGVAGPEPVISGIHPSTPASFFAGLRDALPRDAILALDSGRHQMLARRHFPVLAPRGLLAPSDFQSMGFGIPAAIGASLAAPERRVVALIGDGGLAMSGMELLTAARERLPVTVIVFNDGALGLIRQQQIREFGHAHGVHLGPLDCRALAAATGAGYALLDGQGVSQAVGPSGGDGPVLVEVQVGDSPRQRGEHALSAAKAGARRALGAGAVRWLKRLLGR